MIDLSAEVDTETCQHCGAHVSTDFRRTFGDDENVAHRCLACDSRPAAVDLLDRIEENARFHIESLSSDARATGKALFRQHEPLSFVNACIVAYMQTEGLGYLYAFDDDFDAVDDVYRLDTATDPYEPS